MDQIFNEINQLRLDIQLLDFADPQARTLAKALERLCDIAGGLALQVDICQSHDAPRQTNDQVAGSMTIKLRSGQLTVEAPEDWPEDKVLSHCKAAIGSETFVPENASKIYHNGGFSGVWLLKMVAKDIEVLATS